MGYETKFKGIKYFDPIKNNYVRVDLPTLQEYNILKDSWKGSQSVNNKIVWVSLMNLTYEAGIGTQQNVVKQNPLSYTYLNSRPRYLRGAIVTGGDNLDYFATECNWNEEKNSDDQKTGRYWTEIKTHINGNVIYCYYSYNNNVVTLTLNDTYYWAELAYSYGLPIKPGWGDASVQTNARDYRIRTEAIGAANFGRYNEITKDNRPSFTAGYQNTIHTYIDSTKATGFSGAVGQLLFVSGSRAFASGFNAAAVGNGSTVFGCGSSNPDYYVGDIFTKTERELKVFPDQNGNFIFAGKDFHKIKISYNNILSVWEIAAQNYKNETLIANIEKDQEDDNKYYIYINSSKIYTFNQQTDEDNGTYLAINWSTSFTDGNNQYDVNLTSYNRPSTIKEEDWNEATDLQKWKWKLEDLWKNSRKKDTTYHIGAGVNSFTAGWGNLTLGVAATTFGKYNMTTGDAALTFGDNNNNEHWCSLVGGIGNSSTIAYQTVLGPYADTSSNKYKNCLFVLGNGSADHIRKTVFAIDGNGNIISKQMTEFLQTKVYRDNNNNTDYYSIHPEINTYEFTINIGSGNNNYGGHNYLSMFGCNNTIDNRASHTYIFGSNNEATLNTNHGFAFGKGLRLRNSMGFFGKYNNNTKTDNGSGIAFGVGNGSDNNNRSNAFEVYANGKVRGGKETAENDDSLTLTTKNYVDNMFEKIKNILKDNLNLDIEL